VAADDCAYGGFLLKPCGRRRVSRFLAAGVRETGVSALLCCIRLWFRPYAYRQACRAAFGHKKRAGLSPRSCAFCR
jgi:hypothetical protein